MVGGGGTGTPTGDQTITLSNDNGHVAVCRRPWTAGYRLGDTYAGLYRGVDDGDGFALPADDVTVTVGDVEAEVVSVVDGSPSSPGRHRPGRSRWR